jgi:hypothetical protein
MSKVNGFSDPRLDSRQTENGSLQTKIKSLQTEIKSLQTEIYSDENDFKIKWDEKALWFILGCLTFLTGFSIVWANSDSRNSICSNSDD